MSKLSHAGLNVGVADADITPPVGIYNRCWGAAHHDQASGVHRPLKVCVWVIHSEPSIVLVGMDGSWWQGAEREFDCRHAIATAAETTPEHVLLCLSHSHSAVPLVDSIPPGPGGEILQTYLDDLPQQLALVTECARNDCIDSILQATYGSCTLAACRDQPGEDGWVVGHDANAQADQTFAVARLTNMDGRVRSILVNYACHPTSLGWENTLISPDYIGSLREQISNAYDAPLLFLQGSGGDLAPAWQYSGDPAVADRNGECLALSVRSVVTTLPFPGKALAARRTVSSGAELGCWAPIDVPLSRVSHIESMPVNLPWRDDFESTAALEAAMASSTGPEQERLRRRHRLRRQFGDPPSLTLQAFGARFGEILFFGAPAENYSDLQRDLRERFADNVVLVANHCNGGSGYLMPADLHRRKGFYPAWQSPTAAGSFERMRQAFHDLGGALTK